MMGADCTRHTFSGTLFPNAMIWCDRVAAGMTMKFQHIAHNGAGVINTFIYVNHDPSPYWGNNNGMTSDVIVLHKVTLGAQIHMCRQLQLECWRPQQKPLAE